MNGKIEQINGTDAVAASQGIMGDNLTKDQR